MGAPFLKQRGALALRGFDHQQGLSTIEDAPKRLEAAPQNAKAAGGSLKEFLKMIASLP